MERNDDTLALAAAADQLYAVFAGYPLRADLPACPHCVDAGMQVVLHHTPLHLLTAGDLEHYAGKAMTTWGDLADFKHFLPRLLELATEPSWSIREYVVYKLEYGRWWTWPEVEQAAVVQYLHALWRAVLSAYPSPLDELPVERWLSWLQALTPDLTWYLAAWQEDARLAATMHLAELVNDVVHGKTFNRPLGGKHSAGAAETRRVLVWLSTLKVRARLEAAFFASPDAAQQSLLSNAVLQLDWLPALIQAHSA